MKNIFVIVFLSLFILPSALAINIDVEKKSSGEVLIPDLNQSVTFDLQVTNHGKSDNFLFYNLLGFYMFPVGTVAIPTGQTKDISLEIAPIGEFDHRGFYTLQYFIQGDDDSRVEKELTFKSIDLKEAFEVGSQDINPDINTLEIYLSNKVDVSFEKIDVVFSSEFFEIEKTFSLESKETKNFTIELNKEDFKELIAGFYTIKADISVEGISAYLENTLKFPEKEELKVEKKDYGFFINTQIINKINQGNIPVQSGTIVDKNILSRFFTTLSPEPDIVERKGFKIYYVWDKEIKPGEDFEIVIKTNWLFPFLIVLLIIALVILARIYLRTNLVLRKRVRFVHAKGGEFALRVSIMINAKNYIEKISLIDRIPSLVKIHKNFGGEQPTKVDAKTKRITWNFDKLEAGEVRTVSYLVYSKIGLLGKFALPSATAIYESEGKVHETVSNKTFFVADQEKSKKNKKL